MKRKLFAIFLALGFSVVLVGCSVQQTAQEINTSVLGVLNIATAEIPQLPAGDQATVAGFVALGKTLNIQASTCITGAGNTKANILQCFNTFLAGLLNPTELAELRILSIPAQTKVELYATAITIGINIAFTQWGKTTAPLPAIAPVPTSAELHYLSAQLEASGYPVQWIR